MYEILIVTVIFLMVFSYLVNKKLSNDSEIVRNNYLLAKRKLRNSQKGKKNEVSNEDDDVEDFIESLPSWLTAAAQGANIDLEGVFYGDEAEIQKVKDLLNKNFGEKSSIEDVIR